MVKRKTAHEPLNKYMNVLYVTGMAVPKPQRKYSTKCYKSFLVKPPRRQRSQLPAPLEVVLSESLRTALPCLRACESTCRVSWQYSG